MRSKTSLRSIYYPFFFPRNKKVGPTYLDNNFPQRDSLTWDQISTLDEQETLL